MRVAVVTITMLALVAPVARAQQVKTYVGVITDTMCATDHRSMKVSPDAKCVKDCVQDGRTYKYALADGKGVYKLSDQETPAKFAGKRVKITGALFTKTNILRTDTIVLAE